MSNPIYFCDFLFQKKILHSETPMDYESALTFFIQHQKDYDMITYSYIKHFYLFQVSVLEKDENHHLFLEHSLEKLGDIVDHISILQSTVPMEISFSVDHQPYPLNDRQPFLLVSAPYSECRIRFTFLEKPTLGDEFQISFRYYLLNSDSRKQLQNKNVLVNHCMYKNGTVVQVGKKSHPSFEDMCDGSFLFC